MALFVWTCARGRGPPPRSARDPRPGQPRACRLAPGQVAPGALARECAPLSLRALWWLAWEGGTKASPSGWTARPLSLFPSSPLGQGPELCGTETVRPGAVSGALGPQPVCAALLATRSQGCLLLLSEAHVLTLPSVAVTDCVDFEAVLLLALVLSGLCFPSRRSQKRPCINSWAVWGL